MKNLLDYKIIIKEIKMLQVQGYQPCKNVCSIFRAEKCILDEKTVFSLIVQYVCVVKLGEKTVFS